MDARAREALLTLLRAGERQEAGVRSRPASLTAAALKAYRDLRVLAEKEAFEAAVGDARARGIIELTWDRDGPQDGFIRRIDLLDPVELARFLDLVPATERVARAKTLLQPEVSDYPVLADVLQRFTELKAVRGFGADRPDEWTDALRVVRQAESLRRSVDDASTDQVPIRMASARLFQDSKRIEALTPLLDVLLSGSIASPPRDPADVWAELGLFREEQPIRMAGRVALVRPRVTALLDAPYAAFPAAAVLGVDPAQAPTELLTIENLTTFHSEAKRRCEESVLLIYTAGTPSPAFRALYARVLRSLPEGATVRHWGDVDEGGFRIAAQLAAVASGCGRQLAPWRMHPSDVPEARQRAAEPGTVARMQHFARQAGWDDIAAAVGAAGFTVEQEAL